MTPASKTLIVVGDQGKDLLPESIRQALGDRGRASRLHEHYCVTWTDLEPEEARARLASSDWPCAVGPEEVWRRFEDLRGEFTLQVERMGFGGPSIVEVPLAQIIVGDRPRDSALSFRPWMLERDQDAPTLAPIQVAATELALAAPGLAEQPASEIRDLNGCSLYILDRFSLQTVGPVVPGVEFVSARDLMQRTNFVALWNQASRGPSQDRCALPAGFTGAFITRPNPSHRTEFWDAQVSRILAAAVASTPVEGEVTVQLYFAPGEFRYRLRTYESWAMPFRPWPVRARWTISRDDETFWRALGALSSSNETRFASAKEDYRALSLETAADSRHSPAPALRYTQIWMAIERLLPFRHETSLQLALALSALTPATDRNAMFRRLKALYDVRSEIAHGYAFKRNDEIQNDIGMMASIFRRLFKLSLAYDSEKTLRGALIAHVLDGQVAAIDSQGSSETA